MVVPTARSRMTYKYHAPPKVKGTKTEFFLPAKFIPILPPSHSDFINGGSPAGTTLVTYLCCLLLLSCRLHRYLDDLND